MASQSISTELEALERFVVENDELFQLEEAIGRFNIFDALGIARVEIRHSNFLAWLLDPSESHGQGGLFLKAVLMDLLRYSPVTQRPLSPVELDGIELRGVEIRREWHNIDLLIICQDPQFLIIIENKIDSGEHSNQLGKYEAEIQTHFPGQSALFAFLTRSGIEASDDSWVGYSYADLHRVLVRVRTASANAIGDDVLTFLDHYLRLIGSRFMDDPKIDELCRKIYRNHRQALDLIWDRIGEGGFIVDVEELLRAKPDRWVVVNRTSRHVDFVPTEWLAWLPPLCALPKSDPRFWLVWRLGVNDGKCRLRVLVRPCADVVVRRAIVERMLKDEQEFGFAISGQATDKWTTVYSTTIDQWKEDEEPDREKLLTKIEQRLDSLQKKLWALGDALGPILKAVTKS